MNLWLSLLYFGVPCALFNLSVRLLIPLLDHSGVPLFANFLIGVGGPLLLLFVASLVAYGAEGRPWSLGHFRARFRLGSMTAKTWLWTLALTVVMLFGPPLLAFSSAWIRSIAPPSEAVARMFEVGQNGFMGMPVSGAYLVLGGFVVFVIVNVLGEELWWRGYVLPRQEASMGGWAWLVNGLLWALFHSFFQWEVIGLLPGALALAYVAQRRKSTWPGIVAHLAVNVPSIVLLLMGVLG
jgi:membrane protease YdiL (CAAX protease family)